MKTIGYTSLGLRIDDDLRDEIARAAEREERTLSAQIRLILRDWRQRQLQSGETSARAA